MERDISWIYQLKTDVPIFLERLRGKQRPGFYHYSLTGDFFGERIRWGLGNAVFFLKIIYTLGLQQQYTTTVNDVIAFVQSFQKESGFFYDPLVQALSIPRRWVNALRGLRWSELQSRLSIIAETRQAISSLRLFHIQPQYAYRDLPRDLLAVDEWLEKLDWRKPWDAGSYFSHLLFFLSCSEMPNKQELIARALAWVRQLQQADNGFWYRGNPSAQQKVNGAMKIMTGFKAAGEFQVDFPQALVDSVLGCRHDAQACDNFNIVYVLKYCNELLGGNYRLAEIEDFMLQRLEIYRQFYYPAVGGFSFGKRRANAVYYQARITRGKDEPDIHGTVLFLWGISVMAPMLGVDAKLGFKEFIT